MIKKITSILILTLSIFILSSCTKPNVDKEAPYINILNEENYVRVGEEIELLIDSSEGIEFNYSVDDEEIATVDEFGYLLGISVGEVLLTIQPTSNPTFTKTFSFFVKEPVVNKITVSGINYGNIGDVLTLKYTLFPKDIKSKFEVSVENDSIAKVNKDNTITLQSYGVTNVVVKAKDEEEFTYKYKICCCDLTKFYCSSGMNLNLGDVINYKGNEYYYGFNASNDFNDLTNKLTDNSTLEVATGSYLTNLTIKKNNVKLIGTGNSNINSTITLVDGVKDFTIEGFNFDNKGHIAFNGNNENILIQNNVFGKSLVSNTTSDIPFIKFNSTNISYNNITIFNNAFYNINSQAIYINNMNNLKITQNIFDSIKGNCVYFYDPAPSQSAQWLIKGNNFNNCFRAIESKKMSGQIQSYDTIISIFDNTFDSVTDYCVYLDGNTNSTVTIDGWYNEFKNCRFCVYLDTLEENTDSPKLHATFNYNNVTETTPKFIIRTSDDTINTIYGNHNYVINNVSPSVSSIFGLFSSNVLVKNSESNVVKIDNKNKIYGKSALFTDELTSFICENANKFSSSNEQVLTIDNNGKVTPIKEGEATIKAYLNNDLINEVKVTVYGELQFNYINELLRIAYSQEGYHEGANNLTKYGEWYAEQVHDKSFANGAWCAMYVSWCANQAGIPTNVIPLYASVSIGMSWFQQRGLFKYKEDYKPKAGDIIFFKNDGASHTGIVITYDSKTGTVYTIEGNTSDCCAKRSYNWNYSKITGYGTPQYPKYDAKQVIEFDVSGATDGSGASTR